jgi:hypothetical protein
MSYTNPGPAITTGSTITGTGSPWGGGASATSTVGFYGVTPITQPTNAAQAALTLTTAIGGGYGFNTATAFNAFTAQLENIRASLVLLGLLKGS